MLLMSHQVSPDGIWGHYDYRTTWPYGWDFILEATQFLVDTDIEQVQQLQVGVLGREETDIVEEFHRAGRRLSDTSASQENGFLSIAGHSRIMECALKIVLVNQTAGLRLSAMRSQIPQEARDDPQAFTTYVSSLEINGHVAIARREATT